MSEPSLMDLIQLHERKWGEKDYPGRPSLDSLMASKVVVMWLIGERFILTIHESIDELSDLAHRIITGHDPLGVPRSIYKVFVDKRQTTFRLAVFTTFADARKPLSQAAPAAETLFDSDDEFELPTGAWEALNLKPGRKTKLLAVRNVDPLPGREVEAIKIRKSKDQNKR